MSNDPITSTVLALPFEARVDLVETILRSLHAEIDPARKSAWVRLAEERFAAYERGEMKAHSTEDVMREVRAKFAK